MNDILEMSNSRANLVGRQYERTVSKDCLARMRSLHKVLHDVINNITVKSPETLLRIPLLHCPKDTDCDTAKGLGPCRMQSIRFRATLQHLPNNKFHYICSASLCGSTLYRVRHILCVSYFWANAFVLAQTRVSHIYKALPRSSRARSTTSLDHKSLSKFALYSTHNSIQSNPKSIQFTKKYQNTSTKQQQQCTPPKCSPSSSAPY